MHVACFVLASCKEKKHSSSTSVLQLTAAIDETDDERWKEWDRGIVGAEWACQKADVWPGRCSEGELLGGVRAAEAGVTEAVMGLAEVSWQAGRWGEEKEQRERERSRHASYVMIIRKHRGRLFSALPGLGGTGPGPWAGVQGVETQERREEGREGERDRQTDRQTGKWKL